METLSKARMKSENSISAILIVKDLSETRKLWVLLLHVFEGVLTPPPKKNIIIIIRTKT